MTEPKPTDKAALMVASLAPPRELLDALQLSEYAVHRARSMFDASQALQERAFDLVVIGPVSDDDRVEPFVQAMAGRAKEVVCFDASSRVTELCALLGIRSRRWS